MTAHQLFPFFNGATALCWPLLIFVPLRWHWPRDVAVLVALGLALAYAALIAVFIHQGKGDFQSLAGVARLFEHPGLLLAGWVHYLAFDLLLGVWQRGEAQRIGLSQWLLAPCLFMTFMFGPIGWLLFMGLRQFRLRSAS